MRIVVFLLIVVTLLATTVHGRRGGSSSGIAHRGGSSCTDDACKYIAIAGGVVFWLTVFFAILRCCCGGSRCTGQASRSNKRFVNLAFSKTLKSEVHEFIFQSGFWNCRYYRSDDWHGPYRFSLTFNPQSMTVIGVGTDDIGIFDIEGFYSHSTRRIAFTKTYQTSKESENSKRQLTIQLVWNTKEKKFKGKWYEQTKLNKEKGAFELAYHNEQDQLPFERV